MRGVLVNRHRTADTPNLAAQGQSVSRKTVAEVPLTGLSFNELAASGARLEHCYAMPVCHPARVTLMTGQ